jgi:hypothetical protein
MLTAGLVLPAKLLELFSEAEPMLMRYPAIDAPSLRARVMAFAAGEAWA